MLRLTRTLSLLAIGAAASVAGGNTTFSSCKNIPGDPGWPTPDEWDALNHTVGGRLIATVPAASVCHLEPYDDYNATACAALKAIWDFPQAHFTPPAEIGSAWFQPWKNQSCNPYTAVGRPCELGNYVSYAINVSSAGDVVAGINFAKENNVRLVIKNTGHDVLGKSTGKGGLSLWTWNLKSTQIIPAYSSAAYHGPAIKLGAGVMAVEAYEAADSEGYRVVGGSCPTVGITGGYSQGGGHSALSSLYGLSADNILEWEVVTADGEHLTATPTSNTDLYWALSGGGGGTFGVVLSMTTRLYEDGPIGGAALSFNDSAVGNVGFWNAVQEFHATLPPLLDDGNNTVAYVITYDTFTTASVTAPGANTTQVTALFQPFLNYLTSHSIPYTFSTYSSPTFLDHFAHDFGPLPYGPFTVSQLVTSRLVPREVVLDTEKNAALTQVLRNTTQSPDYYILCQALDVGNGHPAVADNAVLPAWRDTVSHCLAIAPWDWTVPRSVMAAREHELADVITPALDAVTPGSGTYLNEANFRQHNWQQEFYGANYARLLSIKATYDPEELFYARTAVGSEGWAQDPSGRLCRT